MSEVRQQAGAQAGAQAPQQQRQEPAQPTLWVGWVLFGATMMIILGAFQAIAGLVALFNESYFAVPSNGLVVSVGYDTWGWVHLVVGIAAFAAGLGLMRGSMWARVTGVVVALISAIVNVAFLAAFPLWAGLMIAFDVIVIYAIIGHGQELRQARP